MIDSLNTSFNFIIYAYIFITQDSKNENKVVSKVEESSRKIAERQARRKNLYFEMKNDNDNSQIEQFEPSRNFLENSTKFELYEITEKISSVADFAIYENERNGIGGGPSTVNNINVNLNFGNINQNNNQSSAIGESNKRIEHYKHKITGCELDEEYTVIGYIDGNRNIIDVGNADQESYCIASRRTMDQMIRDKILLASVLKWVSIVGVAVGACLTLYDVVKHKKKTK